MKKALPWIVWVIFGVEAFDLARVLVWGRFESLLNPLILGIGFLPYWPLVVGAILYRRAGPDAAFGDTRAAHLTIAWTVCLMLFVILRGSGLAGLYEDMIYDNTDPGVIRYLSLSALYSSLTFLFLWRDLETSILCFLNNVLCFFLLVFMFPSQL